MNTEIIVYEMLAILLLCGVGMLVAARRAYRELEQVRFMTARFAVEDALELSSSRTLTEVTTWAEKNGYRATPEHIRIQYEEYLCKRQAEASAEASLQRIEKAANLLLNPHYSIENIAAELGYASPETFTNEFKKQKGMTPEEFRTKVTKAHKPDETQSLPET